MTHTLMIVFIEPEHAQTEESRDARVAELLTPYKECENVRAGGCSCTDSAGTGSLHAHIAGRCERRPPGPLRGDCSGRWNYYTRLKTNVTRICWGLVLPDEGWFDQREFNGGAWPSAGETPEGWEEVFSASLEQYSTLGYVPLLVDCHSMLPTPLTSRCWTCRPPVEA